MQKRFFLAVVLIAALQILNTGCSKDNDDDPPAAKTKTELLTTGSWKFEKIDPALAESYIACFTDNTITFSADGKGTNLDGTVLCTTSTNTFNWNFTDSETKLHLDATIVPSGSENFTIVTLNETSLVLKQDITSPVPATITVTFKH